MCFPRVLLRWPGHVQVMRTAWPPAPSPGRCPLQGAEPRSQETVCHTLKHADPRRQHLSQAGAEAGQSVPTLRGAPRAHRLCEEARECPGIAVRLQACRGWGTASELLARGCLFDFSDSKVLCVPRWPLIIVHLHPKEQIPGACNSQEGSSASRADAPSLGTWPN